MNAKTLMVMGSMSSVGKSLLVTALCRIFSRRGIRVAPFKAQNMSNNAAVCRDGGEIGRAQALQALAAGIPPTVDMNPVLIKPEADSRSQVILLGRPWNTMQARVYYEKKDILWRQVTNSLDRLREQFDLVIIEGAGSAAELNLKRNDIVNMAVAKYAASPVLLAGDIDLGGIFAQLLGTLDLLESEERSLVRGLLVNKFRGDPALFIEGIKILEEKGKVPVLGVIPYLWDLNLPDEDAVSVERADSGSIMDDTQVDIAVIAFPRIANFDDFDPLKAEPGVRVRFIQTPDDLGTPDAIILPGTKSTVADLEWMRNTGLAQAVNQFALNGGAVVGICGGYQMLGGLIEDPDHTESKCDSIPGLGLLRIQTRFVSEKATFQAVSEVRGGPGWLADLSGMQVSGYEIHMGRTTAESSWLLINNRNDLPVNVLDGGASPDGKIWGCYMHGLFANDDFRRAWLTGIGWQKENPVSQETVLQASLDLLADTVEKSIDMALLERIIWN